MNLMVLLTMVCWHCIAVANSITVVKVIIEYAAIDYVQFYNAIWQR